MEHERYKCISGSKKYYFYIGTDTIIEDINWIKDNKIDSVRLSQSSGYRANNLDPILELTNIKYLDIFIEKADLSKLTKFRNLIDLGIGEAVEKLDLSSLNQLRELYLVYTKNTIGLDKLINLEQLILVRAGLEIFKESVFGSWRKLRDLTILTAKFPADLSFLNKNSLLTSLEVCNVRSVFSALDLYRHEKNLNTLKIGKCKKIVDLEQVIPALKNLQWLTIVDSITLRDSKFVEYLPNLDTLIILGSSFFENGDIDNLKGRVKTVSIDDKKHYSFKHKDFQ
jgi:hypothetical protein